MTQGGSEGMGSARGLRRIQKRVEDGPYKTRVKSGDFVGGLESSVL